MCHKELVKVKMGACHIKRLPHLIACLQVRLGTTPDRLGMTPNHLGVTPVWILTIWVCT